MSTAVEEKQSEAQQTCAKTGTFCWNELITRDVKAAKDFYTGLFGWKTEPMPGPAPYTLFKIDDRMVAGLMTCPEGKAPPQWLAYIKVDDVDACAKKARELGAKILLEPKDIPDVGRIAVFSDPQGAPLGVFRPEED